MTTHHSIGLVASTLGALLISATAAVAELESENGRVAGPRVASIACDVSDEAVVTEVCVDALMRWRLCERGFQSAGLSRAGLFQCFAD